MLIWRTLIFCLRPAAPLSSSSQTVIIITIPQRRPACRLGHPTGVQPLNWACNLTLSSTRRWTAFKLRSRPSLDRSQTRIHTEMSSALSALCAHSGSAPPHPVWHQAASLGCQSSDGNHTKLDQYCFQEGESCVLLLDAIGNLGFWWPVMGLEQHREAGAKTALWGSRFTCASQQERNMC